MSRSPSKKQGFDATMMVRVKRKQLARYRALAESDGYGELASWVRASLDRLVEERLSQAAA
jgi:hypothetical protein